MGLVSHRNTLSAEEERDGRERKMGRKRRTTRGGRRKKRKTTKKEGKWNKLQEVKPWKEERSQNLQSKWIKVGGETRGRRMVRECKEEEEGDVGIQRCFLILLVCRALPWRLRGRSSYKTKIRATKAAGGCWLRRRPTLGPNYLRHGNFPRLKDKWLIKKNNSPTPVIFGQYPECRALLSLWVWLWGRLGGTEYHCKAV